MQAFHFFVPHHGMHFHFRHAGDPIHNSNSAPWRGYANGITIAHSRSVIMVNMNFLIQKLYALSCGTVASFGFLRLAVSGGSLTLSHSDRRWDSWRLLVRGVGEDDLPRFDKLCVELPYPKDMRDVLLIQRTMGPAHRLVKGDMPSAGLADTAVATVVQHHVAWTV